MNKIPKIFLILLTVPAPVFADTGPILRLTVADAVVQMLKNNTLLAVQRLDLDISRESLVQQNADFDPMFSVSYDGQQDKSKNQNTKRTTTTNTRSSRAGVTKKFRNGQELDVSGNYSDQNVEQSSSGTDMSSASIDWTIPLGEGRGRDVTLADVRMAENNIEVSKYDLKNYLINLVVDLQTKYWNAVEKLNLMKIREQSLALTRRQLDETKLRIELGKTAEIELVAARAEEASRQQDLINSQSEFENVRLDLLRLMSTPENNRFDFGLELLDEPNPDTRVPTAKKLIKTGLASRPDLLQARLQIANADLTVIKTKNGLLPNVDFVLGGDYEYSDVPAGADLEDKTIRAGISVSFPWNNRQDESEYRVAKVDRQQADLALANLTQLVELEIRQAVIEISRTSKQIEATRIAQELQAEKLRAEQEKFRVGRSTNILVFQAERDYTQSQIAMVSSLIANEKAWLALYQATGTLLEQQGITWTEK